MVEFTSVTINGVLLTPEEAKNYLHALSIAATFIA